MRQLLFRGRRMGAVIVLRTLARACPALATRLASSRIAATVAGEGSVVAKRLGTSLALELGDNVQRTLFFTGTYEPQFQKFLQAELRRGDVYIDVGGHIGIHAAAAARRLHQLGGGCIYVFEPAPDTVACLRHVLASSDNAYVITSALGTRRSHAPLRSDPAFGMKDASTRSLFGDGDVVAVVDVTTFDQWATEQNVTRIDIVKIDAEGSEYDVLSGMRHSLLALAPRIVIVEMERRRMAQAGHTAQEIVGLLDECGYARSAATLQDNAVFRHTSSA